MYLNNSETNRLKIRKLYSTDVKVWENLFINNTNLNYPGLDNSLSISEQSFDWINRQTERYKSNWTGHYVLIEKRTEKFIGQAGFLIQEIDGVTEIEIGYHILPEYWVQGFAEEAMQRLRNYTFENKIATSVISVIDVRNKVSQRVAEEIGMKVEKQINLFKLDVFIYRINVMDMPSQSKQCLSLEYSKEL